MNEPTRGQSWPFPTRCGPPMTPNQRAASALQIDADMVERACRAAWTSFDRMRPDHAAEKRVKMQAALAAALYGGRLRP